VSPQVDSLKDLSSFAGRESFELSPGLVERKVKSCRLSALRSLCISASSPETESFTNRGVSERETDSQVDSLKDLSAKLKRVFQAITWGLKSQNQL
jgi:hypothetical protein